MRCGGSGSTTTASRRASAGLWTSRGSPAGTSSGSAASPTTPRASSPCTASVGSSRRRSPGDAAGRNSNGLLQSAAGEELRELRILRKPLAEGLHEDAVPVGVGVRIAEADPVIRQVLDLREGVHQVDAR